MENNPYFETTLSLKLHKKFLFKIDFYFYFTNDIFRYFRMFLRNFKIHYKTLFLKHEIDIFNPKMHYAMCCLLDSWSLQIVGA